MSKPVIAALHNSYITRDGVFKIAKFAHRKHFLLNLPKPPFMVCCGSGNNAQHAAWKTPVNLAREVFTVRVGQRLYQVDMDLVLRFVAGLEEGKPALLHTDGRLTEHTCGQPHPRTIGAPYRPADIAAMNPGEWWAYSALIYKDIAPPERVTLK
jgi:hypothetical protein